LNFDIVEEILAEQRPDILVKAQFLFNQVPVEIVWKLFQNAMVSLEEFSYFTQN
jgi:hypothetical protein